MQGIRERCGRTGAAEGGDVELCQANRRTIGPVGARLTEKGQITIPRHVRDGLGLRPGDEVEFVAEGGGYRLRKVLRSNPFTRYRGHLTGLAGQNPDELVGDLRGE
jgi:antitoxin PrlF